jgi:hypothetical protein
MSELPTNWPERFVDQRVKEIDLQLRNGDDLSTVLMLSHVKQCAWMASHPTESIPATELTFADALRIARGCLVRGEPYQWFKDSRGMGVDEVITALEQAAKSGLNDPQVAALWKMGGDCK